MISLLATLNDKSAKMVNLTSDQLRRLTFIDETDYSTVRMLVTKEFGKQSKVCTPEILDTGILGLKQYYSVAVLDGANAHAVSDEVDPYWHAHILCTEEYKHFCEESAGYFMHHEPLDHAQMGEVEFVKKLYEYTTDIMAEMFNPVSELFPKTLPDMRLVCAHYNNNSPATYLFDKLPGMQIERRVYA